MMYRVELYEQELRSSKKGREILGLIEQHGTEIISLINHNREVMVTWQRNNGARLFSQFMETAFDKNVKVKKELDAVSLATLIRRMVVVLQDHSTVQLRKAIDQYWILLLGYSQTCDSFYDVFQKIRQYE